MSDWWIDYPWRLIQTNLREIDMLDIRAERVVADLRSFDATVLMINAAGIIASYPTKLPHHFQSPYLKGDSLQAILDACHQAGIRAMARTDFSKVRRPIYDLCPPWAYRDPRGQIVDYNGDVHVCINGGYQQDYALKIIEELITTYDFDGIFFNMGGYQTRDYSGNYHGICHCDSCQRLFREMFELDLPEREDLEDATFRKYVLFKRRTTRALDEKVNGLIRALRPDMCVANHQFTRRGIIRQESNTAIDRSLPHWQYSGSENTKWAAASYPTMVSSNTTVDFIDFPYRHVAVSPHQQQLRLVQSLANGGALDYYLIGRLDNHADRSGFAPIREIFQYHAAHAEAYTGLRSMADIALLNGSHANGGEFRGWFRTLVENHFLFDVLMTDAALDLPWEKYRAIILPDLQAVSAALAKRIDDFAGSGGIVIASGRAAFRDETYAPRDTPALRCLGVEQIDGVKTDTSSTYFQLQPSDKNEFPRFEQTDLIYMAGPYVSARYAPAVERHLRMIPPHHYGPPERCYYTQESDQPAFVTNTFERGQAIYIPWLAGELFHRQGHPNTLDFLADLVQHVAGIQPVGGNLSPMVEVTLQEKIDGSGMLLHLVNGSGHFGNSFFEPVPINGVRVTAPTARPPARVFSLSNGQTCDHHWNAGHLTIEIPRLNLFDAIEIVR